MYQKSEHIRESNLKYYEHRYYNKLKDDYYQIKTSDSIYRCSFCYNIYYSLTDLLRHASRMAGNLCKTIKDIAKHFVLITYIQRYLNVKFDEIFSIIYNDTTEIKDAYVVGKNRIIESVLQEEIDVARKTKAFSTSMEPVEEYSITEPIVSIKETDEHMVSLRDGANRNDESQNKERSIEVKKSENFMFVPIINPYDGGVSNTLSNTHAFKDGDDSISTCLTYNKGDGNVILGNNAFDRDNFVSHPRVMYGWKWTTVARKKNLR